MLRGWPLGLRMPAAAGSAPCTLPWVAGGAALGGHLGGLRASPVAHSSSYAPMMPPAPLPRVCRATRCAATEGAAAAAAAGAAASRGGGRAFACTVAAGSARRPPDPAGLRGLLHEGLSASVATRGSGLARPRAPPGFPADAGARGVRGDACPCSMPRSLRAERALVVPGSGARAAALAAACSAAFTARASASARVAKPG